MDQKLKNDNLPLALNRLGIIHEAKKNYSQAVKCFADAIEVLLEIDPSGQKSSLVGLLQSTTQSLARNEARAGEYHLAIQHYHQHMELVPVEMTTIAEDLFQIANIYGRIQANEDAIENYKKSLSIWREEKDDKRVAKVVFNMSMIYEKKADFNSAKESLGEVSQTFKQPNDLILLIFEIKFCTHYTPSIYLP